MYYVVARILEGNKVIGYKLYCNPTKTSTNVSVNVVRQLIQTGLVSNMIMNKKGVVSGNGIDLRKLPKINSLTYNELHSV